MPPLPLAKGSTAECRRRTQQEVPPDSEMRSPVRTILPAEVPFYVKSAGSCAREAVRVCYARRCRSRSKCAVTFCSLVEAAQSPAAPVRRHAAATGTYQPAAAANHATRVCRASPYFAAVHAQHEMTPPGDGAYAMMSPGDRHRGRLLAMVDAPLIFHASHCRRYHH